MSEKQQQRILDLCQRIDKNLDKLKSDIETTKKQQFKLSAEIRVLQQRFDTASQNAVNAVKTGLEHNAQSQFDVTLTTAKA